ncbi:hypothetical protein LV89_02027 [Arcicella aurantiaca]|uniref:Uncharacterized protein n=1 Tax=Arcicella aurantiaca TaxID=591202 RepID=A0A316E9N6_9BACT|nr:hypothetical protein [Arcicella aurantiaca]PWK27210.1 hypothetical protein LV89_02027 [Arcicella aurantiaca]
MEENQFKIGNTVSLKSGSVRLTVYSISDDLKKISLKFWDKENQQIQSIDDQDFRLFSLEY